MLTALTAMICAAGAILPEPIPSMERGGADPRSTFVYRLARGDTAGARDLLGSSVTPEGMMMHLQFSGEPPRAAIPCEVKAVVGPVVQAFCPWGALPRLKTVPGL